jgi:phage tail sheath protein FI
MGVYLSPGVYTREIDVSLYPAAVSTAICAMVGTSIKGPVNSPRYITSPQQYLDTFGNPTTDSFLAYAALGFLEKGNQLYVTRVGTKLGPDALTMATRAVVSGIASTVTASTAGDYTYVDDSFDIIANGAFQTIFLSTTPYTVADIASAINTQAKGFYADSNAGALRLTSTAKGTTSTLEISRINNVPFSFAGITQAIATGTVDETFSITSTNNILKIKINGATEVIVTLPIGGTQSASTIAAAIDAAITNYGGASSAPTSKVQVNTIASGSGVSIEFMTVANSAYSTLGFTVGVVSGTSAIPAGTNTATTVLNFAAINEGTWGNDLTLGIINRADGSFDVVVFYLGVQVERFNQCLRGAANATSDFYIEKLVGTATAAAAGTTTTQQSQFITVADVSTASGFAIDITVGTSTSTFAGGKNGITGIADADYIGVAWDPTTDKPTGMQTFADAERINVNILCVPGVSSTAVVAEMLSLCNNRADCMCIVDPPFGLRPQEVVDWHNGIGSGNTTAFNSSYGALYYDWLQIYDVYNRVNVFIPPSGYIAGVYALNDFVSEPWFAPAGLNRGRILSAIGVRYSPSLGERNLLYGDGNAINPIVNFVQDGITVWGQRTLQRSSTALDRVNVRRLLLYLRKTAAQFSKVFVFEPNDPVTWRRVRLSFEPLLSDVQSRRGITDYKIICDSTINTPARVDRNELWVRILIKPTKAAEFIQIDFVILPQGASLESEILV